VLPILHSVAGALDAAHARGIAHRDLKPENIFLERPDQPEHMLVKLLDFGAATLVERERDLQDQDWLKTKDGVLLGTPDYMSPEQCSGDPVDQRTDIYSLGVVAYQMMVGALPFGSGTPYEVMGRRLLGKPVPPSEALPTLSPVFDEPLLKALQDNPEERFQTASGFVAALEAAGKKLAGGDLVSPEGSSQGFVEEAPASSGTVEGASTNVKPEPPPPPGARDGMSGDPTSVPDSNSSREVGSAGHDIESSTDREHEEDSGVGQEKSRRGVKKWFKSLLKK